MEKEMNMEGSLFLSSLIEKDDQHAYDDVILCYPLRKYQPVNHTKGSLGSFPTGDINARKL